MLACAEENLKLTVYLINQNDCVSLTVVHVDITLARIRKIMNKRGD